MKAKILKEILKKKDKTIEEMATIEYYAPDKY